MSDSFVKAICVPKAKAVCNASSYCFYSSSEKIDGDLMPKGLI